MRTRRWTVYLLIGLVPLVSACVTDQEGTFRSLTVPGHTYAAVLVECPVARNSDHKGPEPTHTPTATEVGEARTVAQDCVDAVPAERVQVSADQRAAIEASAAMLWPTSDPFIEAVNAGAAEEFQTMGIDVVAVTDSQFDPTQQAQDARSLAALSPDVVLSSPVDSAAGAITYEPLTAQGAQITFMHHAPFDFVPGVDHVSVVTGDQGEMGRIAADLLADAPDGEGQIGYVFHDAPHHSPTSETKPSAAPSISTTPASRSSLKPAYRFPRKLRSSSPAC